MVFVLRDAANESETKEGLEVLYEQALTWNLILYNFKDKYLVCNAEINNLSN